MNLHRILLICACVTITAQAQQTNPPVRLAMVGLNHDHALGFLPRLAGRADVQLVGLWKPIRI
jgi:hypothetical protein